MRFWKGICVVIGTVFGLGLAAPDAYAATLYWVGADGANTSVASNWKTTDPAGCGGGDALIPPISTDSVVFDADCDNGATINSALDITSFDMNTGYTGTITQSAALTAATFSQFSGTFAGGSADIDINGSFTLAGGTFTSTTGTFFMGGNWTHTSGGTFTHNSGTVTFDASVAQTIDVATSETFSNLTFAGVNMATISLTVGDTLIATGTVTFTDGAVNTGTIEARGNVSVGTAVDTSSAALSFTGTATQTFSGAGINSLDGDISVNKSGGQVNQGTAFTAGAANQDMTIQEGTYDVNGNNLTVNGTGSTFTVEDGGNLQLQGGETVTTPTLNTGSTVTYDGTSTYTVNDWSYQGLTFNGSGGVFNLGANETVSQVLTITAGTFDISGFNLTTSSTFSNSDVFRLQGAETLTTFTNDTDSGTAEFDGTGTYSSGLVAGDTYYNLTFSGSGSWTLDAALDVNNNFSQSAGTLDVSTSNYAITIGNNWSRSGGTFTARSGTVTFDGTNQTINNSTTFYNLTKQESSNNSTDSTLTIAASTTQTVTNTLNFDGLDADDRLNLVSGTPGTRYTFDVSSAQTVTFLDITDSQASTSNITCTNCVNGGGNDDGEAAPHWVFGSANTAPTVSTPRNITQVKDTIEFEADVEDSDGNKTQLLVEYSTTQSNWKKASLKSVTASQGTVSIDNIADYQISSIDNDSGKITLKVVWDAKQQFDSSEEDTVYLRLTPYDGTDAGTAKISESFALDTRAPVISELYLSGRTSSSLTLAWTPEAEKNFDKYVLCYGLNLTDVKNCNKTAKQWTTTQDSKLSTFSTSQTTITGLLHDRTYHVLLKATDDFSHTSTLLAQNLKTSFVPVAPTLSVGKIEGNTIELTWLKLTNPTFAAYDLCYGQTQSRVTGRICRSTGNPSGAVLKSFTSPDTVSTLLTALKDNTLYYAKMWYRDTFGFLVAGNSVNATTCKGSEVRINGICTPPPPPPPPPACSDGLDNDGDGAVDFGSDPGCSDTNDDDETDPVVEPPPPPLPPPPPPPPPPVPPPVAAPPPPVEVNIELGNNPVAEFIENVVEQVIEQVIEIAQQAVAVVKKVVQTVVAVAKVVAEKLPEVVTKPAVTVPVAVITAASVAASTGLVTVVPNFVGELAYLFQRLLQGLIGLAGVRRRRPWGRVVDGQTGTPLPQAIVRILDRQTQQLKDTAVTDAKGDFASLLPAGQYRFEVNKPGWHLEPHPASFLNILSHQQVYDGNFVDVRHEGVVSIIIAMRPTERVAAQHIILRVVFQRLERFLTSLSWPLLVFGFGLSTFAAAREPTKLNIGIFIFYLALIAAKLWVASHRHKTVGFVKDVASGLALNQALVQLYNAETGRLMATKVTSTTGQFALVPPPGVYTVIVSHPGYQTYRESHVVVHPSRAKALALTFSLTPEMPKTLAVSGLNPT